MSAAKMVADSTISDLPMQDVAARKRKKCKKQRNEASTKRLRKKEDNNDSDLDLSKDLEPLGDYISDRQELLNQMFHCVQGTSLERTLPDILKELTLNDLKQKCLEQLGIMSKKRIRRIIDGDDPADISSSGTEDDSTEGDKQDQQSSLTSDKELDGLAADCTCFVLATEDRNSASGYSDEEQKYAEEIMEPIISEVKNAMAGPNESDDEEELQEVNHSVTGNLNSEINEVVQAEMKADNHPIIASLPPVLTRNQMELLELEMRARAIKAMLKSQGAKNENEVPMDTQKSSDMQSTVAQKPQLKEMNDTMNAQKLEIIRKILQQCPRCTEKANGD